MVYNIYNEMSFEIFVIHFDIHFVICEKNGNVLLESTTLVQKMYTSSKVESIMHAPLNLLYFRILSIWNSCKDFYPKY